MKTVAPVYRPKGERAISIAKRTLELASITIFFYLHSCRAYSPDVNHRAIAGLWKLKQKPEYSPISYPLKEFTVYPKVPNKLKNNENNSKEVLLMLKEDGSFQQYSDQDQKVPDKVQFFTKSDEKFTILDRYCEFGKLRGKWSLVGGKLILATDRPMKEDGTTTSIPKKNEENPDTILEGEVVATTEESLYDNPVLGSRRDGPQADTSPTTDARTNRKSTPEKPVQRRNDAKNSQNPVSDTHLSVPKGQVNVGRFTYPQRHPSFFEAPMFNPRASGKFELQQVLGTLNTQQQKSDEEFEEKFTESDFYNKTFLLTSHPMPKFQPKGNVRWSIKYNKFVEDPPPKSKNKKNEEEMMDQPIHQIRVLEMKFFANNTFATIGGIGSDILRGRFSIVGKEKDHLWLQVILFGFGRSVSGSVFSEGKSLSKDDEKTYWGKIEYVDEESSKGNEESTGAETNEYYDVLDQKSADSKPLKPDRQLIVKGSVLFGYGLEPLPIGKFILAETNSEQMDVFDDEDEDEEVNDLEDEDDNDWKSDKFFYHDDAFQ